MQAITREPVRVVFDILSVPETQAVAYEAVLAPGGFLINSPGPAIEASKLSPEKTVVTVFADVRMPSQRDFGVVLYRNLTALVAAGEIKVRGSWTVPHGESTHDLVVAEPC